MHLPAIAIAAALLASTASAAPDQSLESLAAPEAREAVAAARAGLARFLDAIPKDRTAGYGFADRAEIARARLAPPYHLWIVDPKGQHVAETSEWRFPVEVDGRYRALLTVSPVDGKYQAVDFGAAGLAAELFTLERDRAVAKGSRRVLLRLHALRADLVAFPAKAARVQDTSFEPLASARALENAPQSAVPYGRLMPWIHERVEALPPTR